MDFLYIFNGIWKPCREILYIRAQPIFTLENEKVSHV
jgi:hypothetical protein